MDTDFLQKQDFIPDDKTTPGKKNLILSQHLAGPWFNLNIVKIERINNPPTHFSGWEVTFISMSNSNSAEVGNT